MDFLPWILESGISTYCFVIIPRFLREASQGQGDLFVAGRLDGINGKLSGHMRALESFWSGQTAFNGVMLTQGIKMVVYAP